MSDATQDLKRALPSQYELAGEIGRGGFATVYRARDLRRGSDVAIKVLRPELAAATGSSRFTREVQITARLQHPNILPLLDSGEANGLPFYVMPFVEGESFATRLSRERVLPIDEAARLVGEVADGLAYAHDQGFVHRDIKPDNILLLHGHAVLADFGVARALDVTVERLTESGLALGTVQYMSPEQAAGERIDGRADIYALGCVLYEALTGSPPFTGVTAQAVMARHAVDPPAPIRSVRATVPPALEGVVLRALAKDPVDRFATAAQFRDEVLRAASGPMSGYTAAAGSLRPRRRRVMLVTLSVVAALAALGTWQSTRAGRERLDSNRVIVYPFVTPSDWVGSRTTGEDVATMIGSALDGAGPLRWMDGWSLLSAAQRDEVRLVSAREAAAIARRARARYVLTGRIAMRGDSVDVYLDLRDVTGDSMVARRHATSPVGEVWRAGLAATTQLLPSLIPTGLPDVASEWAARSPAAVAHFLLAEAAFRRVQLEEAERQFSEAVAADSGFGLAAIRGAQAAAWNHHNSVAAAFIAVARRSRLSPANDAFAKGYQHFLRGEADSAAVQLHRALAFDSSRAFVWMQLGEVYSHLLPATGNPDSLVESALAEANRLDSTATYALFHLIEARLRLGDTVRAMPAVARFLAARPDTALAVSVEIMRDCVRRGEAAMRWSTHVRERPQRLLTAMASLGAGGRNWECAAAGFEALLAGDTAATVESDASWYALVGWQGISIGRGDVRRAEAAIDAYIARWGSGTSLFLWDADVLGVFAARAESVAAADARRFGSAYERCSSALRCWLLGMHLVRTGRSAEGAAVAQRLTAPPGRIAEPLDSLAARSLEAHVSLARGDTVRAVAELEALLAAPRPTAAIQWGFIEPQAADRMTLARLMVARGEYSRAIGILQVFDSHSMVHTGLLAPSLDLRARAADALGNVALASAFRARLAALQRKG